jgi:uncharacterized protein
MTDSASLSHVVEQVPILDFHVHFQIGYGLHERRPSPPSRPEPSSRDRAVDAVSRRWRRTFDFPEPESGPLLSLEEEGERWIREADRYGIDRIVFVTTGGIERGRRLQRTHPERFSVFASTNDPFATSVIDEIEAGASSGEISGVKLLAPDLPYRIDDPRGRAFFRLAARRRLPVLIHFGHQGSAGGVSWNDRIEPQILDAVAKEHADVDFVIPHFGVQFVQQLLFLSWGNPNVYTDTSGSNQWVQWMPYPLTLRDLFQRFFETVGPERLVFGSDSSWFPRGFAYRYLADQLRIVHELGWTPEQIRAVFGGNAARLLGISDWPR